MGYMHISNLCKEKDIMLMKECYALEKIHGTSANIRFKKNKESVEGNNLSTILFFSGGTKHGTFVKMFDEKELLKISEIQK